MLPWLERDEDLSGQPPFGFFFLIVLGFMLLGDERIGRDRRWMGVAALPGRDRERHLHLDGAAAAGWPDTTAVFPVKTVYEIGVWCMILGLLGLGHRFLSRRACAGVRHRGGVPLLHPAPDRDRRGGLLRVRSDWPPGSSTPIALASFGLSLGLYEVAVRRWKPVRFLFGMKPPRKVVPPPAAPRVPAEAPPAPTSLPV